MYWHQCQRTHMYEYKHAAGTDRIPRLLVPTTNDDVKVFCILLACVKHETTGMIPPRTGRVSRDHQQVRLFATWYQYRSLEALPPAQTTQQQHRHEYSLQQQRSLVRLPGICSYCYMVYDVLEGRTDTAGTKACFLLAYPCACCVFFRSAAPLAAPSAAPAHRRRCLRATKGVHPQQHKTPTKRPSSLRLCGAPCTAPGFLVTATYQRYYYTAVQFPVCLCCCDILARCCSLTQRVDGCPLRSGTG